MPKLTKGEVQGIRLMADLIVIKDVVKHLVRTDAPGAMKEKDFIAHLQKKVPKVFLAESELKKQIKDIHRVWSEELRQDRRNKE